MIQHSQSLKKNTIANFVGLIYSTSIGIVVLPLYLQYLGAEAFGLVGFFTVLQSWMQLLDMGMSPMLSRQSAYTRGQGKNYLVLKKLLRSLELIVLSLAIVIALSIAAGSTWIANTWLNVSSIDLMKVTYCIVLMGVMIGLRLLASLYRSGIQGIENQVWLNVANVILVTVKFIGALLLLHYITQDIVYFFVYQLLISIIELMVLATMFYSSLPPTEKVGVGFFWDSIKPMLPFAGGIAYTAGIWVLFTQLDKIILSNVLPLSEYGYFTLVAVIATGITQLSSPISKAILPRMTNLLSQNKEREMLLIYRKSTQFMTVIMLPLAGMIALFSTELLYVWTGDKMAAEWAGPILFWFALGNGILAISAFQFYLQFAHGKLKMHVIYNTISAIIQIPLIIFVAFEYGALGVGLVWFTLRLLSFVVWTPIVHSKFAPGIHWPWILKDIGPIFISTTLFLFLASRMNFTLDEMHRLNTFLVLTCIGLSALLVNVFVSKAGRELVFSILSKINR
jgi:O-antigen/teichoic acid export membrane protein